MSALHVPVTMCSLIPGETINKVPLALGMTPRMYGYLLQHTREPQASLHACNAGFQSMQHRHAPNDLVHGNMTAVLEVRVAEPRYCGALQARPLRRLVQSLVLRRHTVCRCCGTFGSTRPACQVARRG
jgi:hypothetical protein